MSKGYGPCVGVDTAIMWVENLTNVDENIKERVLNRMRYEFAKDRPVLPKFRKGVYGRKYDSWSCGNCGYSGIQIHEHYCPNCGFMVDWNHAQQAEHKEALAQQG